MKLPPRVGAGGVALANSANATTPASGSAYPALSDPLSAAEPPSHRNGPLDAPPGQAYYAVVKNTFLEEEDLSAQSEGMKRSASYSDLSRSSSSSSSEKRMTFWLPSFSSQSQSNSRDSKGSQRVGKCPEHASGGVAPELPVSKGSSGQAAADGAFCDRHGGASDKAASMNNCATAASSSESLVEQLHREAHVPLGELQDLHQQGVLQLIPINDEGKVSSIGSIGHAAGECSPCLFWLKKSCGKGIHCQYCHIRHKGQKKKRIRPSKQARMQMQTGPQVEAEAGWEDD